MNITTTIKLTREEYLQAINDYLDNEFKYNSRAPRGEVLDVFNAGAEIHVLWGERPEPEEEPAVSKANTPKETTDAPTP
jgi:hypothetical protein